jgi:hypothetical protein
VKIERCLLPLSLTSSADMVLPIMLADNQSLSVLNCRILRSADSIPNACISLFSLRIANERIATCKMLSIDGPIREHRGAASNR